MLEKLLKIELEIRSQAICNNKLEVLEWFAEDNTDMLYELIMEGKDIDNFIDDMNNRVYELYDTYYILEEDDMLFIQAFAEGE